MDIINRLGVNPWVSKILEKQSIDDVIIYHYAYQVADILPEKICDEKHKAYYFPTVKNYACPTCGQMDFESKWTFSENNQKCLSIFEKLLSTLSYNEKHFEIKKIKSFRIDYQIKL
jgi:hypothetical protein